MQSLQVRFALRVILPYVVAAGLWILFSDRLAAGLFPEPGQLVQVQTYKGWSFVGASSALLYLLFRGELRWRERAEEHIRYQIYYDALTGLPNRTLLVDRLNQVLLAAQREGKTLALLTVDLERFKEINNTLGHSFGDEVLRQVASRLQRTIRKSDTVSHMGGDQFTILLLSADVEGATQTSQKVQKSLEASFIVEGVTLEVEASIGIAVFPQHGENAAALMRCADVAMYGARETGTDYALYEPREDPYTSRRLALMGELRGAIDGNELFLVYQPKVDLRERSVVGVEALIRWRHPEYGFVPPDQFIPLAERSGLIKPLTRWVADEAIRQYRVRREAGLRIPISINLSRRNLHDLELPGHLTQAIQASGVPPDGLELEITESAIMTNVAVATEVVRRLREMGFVLSIDDFGTGYSSLGFLKKLPVQALKIDRSFVKNMAKDEDDAIIIRATIDLAHNLRLKVVAEGVEDQETFDKLTAMGCDAAQGYYISSPLPVPELTRWLNESPWGLKRE